MLLIEKADVIIKIQSVTPEIGTFKTKTRNFPELCMHLYWLTKTELRGNLVVIIVVNYCYKRKMLEETETEETLAFFVTFLSLVTF